MVVRVERLRLAFGAGLYLWRGSGPSLKHLAGYLIEKALSVDNLFIFTLVFSAFGVPARYQHRHDVIYCLPVRLDGRGTA